MADRLTTATINLDSYSHNIAALRKIVGDDVAVMAVIKANAYGHGIEGMAAAAIAAGASYLGVVSLGELKRLRNTGITAPVLLLNYIDEVSVGEAIALHGAITVMDTAVVDAAQAAAAKQSKTTSVHIEIDTGMHRAGCDPDEVVALAQRVAAAPNLQLEGVFTHFAESEDPNTSFTQQQLDIFNRCVATLKARGITPPLLHSANSAATVALPETRFTMVRPGLITYGINPFPPEHPKYSYVTDNFRPVLSLKTRVIHTRTVAPGETVGYNRRWKAERESQLALLPVGYGDGWRRTPHSADHVLINGKSAPVVGSVSMDQIVVDTTDAGAVEIGDEVILIGSQGEYSITADDIARMYETISYEVVTALSDRLDREYVSHGPGSL